MYAMKEETEFEASVKSGITPDAEFIRENDETMKKLREGMKSSPLAFLLFLLAAVGFFFVNKIIMVICTLIGVLALFLFIRKKGMIHKAMGDEYLKDVYEEGLLVPGMIVKTEPLTVMAIANITAEDDCDEQYACYALQVKHLPGAGGTLYEKIPCACFFRYEGGNYHSAYQPHPLNWGTRNQEEIRAAIRRLEEGQTENSEDEWEVIKKISAEYPDLKPDHMLLLDKDYKPVGEKYYMDEKFIPVITEQVRSRYPKINPQASHITDDIPAASVYNKMIDLALQYQVYEYIGTHCKDEDYAPLFNPGYFTFIGDPMTFLEAMNRRNIVLAEGEYPLIAGLMLLTTKGCWNKKEFMPWDEFTLDAAISSLGEIETRVNGKCIVEFKVNTQYYQDKETFTKEDMVFVKQIELDGINHFLKGLKKLSGT